MKATGRVIVCGTREAHKYCSTFALDSKCGMPVFRSAEATLDRTTCPTDAAFAASIAVVPCWTSHSGCTEKSGPNGVVTMKKPSTFRTNGVRLARCVRSPCAPSIPAPASAFNFDALRVSPMTRCPRFKRLRATAPPCCPVAPATRIVFVSAILRSPCGLQAPVLLVDETPLRRVSAPNCRRIGRVGVELRGLSANARVGIVQREDAPPSTGALTNSGLVERPVDRVPDVQGWLLAIVLC